jgi:hypothetical protein
MEESIWASHIFYHKPTCDVGPAHPLRCASFHRTPKGCRFHSITSSNPKRQSKYQFRSRNMEGTMDVGPYLPLEIQESLFPHFDATNDQETLLTCSLVCRAWLPCSRRQAFSLRSHRLDAKNWDRDKRHLTSSASTIAPFIVSVVINEQQRSRPTFLEVFVKEINLKLLPSFQKLSILNLKWSILSDEGKFALHAIVSLLSEIRLDRPAFPSYLEALTLFSAASSLRILDIRGYMTDSVDTSPDTAGQSPVSPPTLQEIDLCYILYHTPTVLAWASTSPSLRSVSLRDIEYNTVAKLVSVLLEMNQRLEHLLLAILPGSNSTPTEGTHNHYQLP